MIILPAERRLDRSNTPIVLIGIILLNILIFFLYQANDSLKFSSAFDEYQKADLLDDEWPLYSKFLLQQERFDDLNEVTTAHNHNEQSIVIAHILNDRAFSDYLNENGRSLFYPSVYYDWDESRTFIREEIESISVYNFGLIPNDLSVIDLVMHQFLHGSFLHLIGNMMFLMICGFVVEGAIGRLAFLGFYILGGVAAGLLHASVNLASDQPLVGASGSISAVMAMYLVLYRWKTIRFFYWFYIIVGYFRAPALILLPVFIGKELISYFIDPDSNVAFIAHAGGFVVGGILVGGLAYFRPGVLNIDYIEATDDDSSYRKQLADIYDALEKYRFETAFHRIQRSIEEHGNEFELLLLRHNILKLKKTRSWLTNLNLLMMKTDLTEQELKQQEKIWKESVDDGAQFTDEVMVNTAINFTRLTNLETAESIFAELKQQNVGSDKLARVANFLAKGCSRLQHPEKQQHYRDFARSMMMMEV